MWYQNILWHLNYTERPIIIAISSYKVNIEAFKLHKGQRNFSSSCIHVHEHFQHSCKPLGLCTLEISSLNDWAMIINDTHSVFSVIKRFLLHKIHKSFTHVNLVDKSAILVEK